MHYEGGADSQGDAKGTGISIAAMKKKPKQTKTVTDALKAYKALRRKEEIELHGKQIRQVCVEVNKKKYTRKRKHKIDITGD